MSERGRRSRDASNRYSIDTLFPGLAGTTVKVKVDECTVVEADKKEGKGSKEVKEVKEVKKKGEVGVGSVEGGAGSSAGGGGRKRAASPLKPATQPKHMSLLSVTKMSKKNMLEVFQPWVLHTYGDSAKTKTITKKKYYRIVKTLRGEEINNAENSKFRFWVKAKGFHIGLPPGHSNPKDERQTVSFTSDPDLYVPTTVKEACGGEKSVYKRVAVVEHFFDIIYTVHVETEAKNGKHAGQKRTYRAITEMYAFLPREAVTKFLLQCMECQKRGSPAAEQPVNGKMARLSEETEDGSKRAKSAKAKLRSSRKTEANFSVPFTTTYLRQQKQERRAVEKAEVKAEVEEEDEEEEADSHLPDPVTPMEEDHPGGKTRDGKNTDGDIGAPVEWLGYHPIALKKEAGGTPTCNNNIYSNGKQDFREQSSPLSLSDRCGVNQEAGQDETSSNGNKDDEDDDDDESEDKIDTQTHDPERLKAFNMFVRLFVDENLDRMVPISKQPKEKIQAIIDSCTRQFPEFAERARKRIRTYLKSCRRNKRSRDSNGWESSRPTPAHLTSVQAEQILAQACENESQNAKRMRMGLEPVGQPLPVPQSQQSEKSSSEVAENGHGKCSGGRSSSRDESEKSGTVSPEKERPAKVSSGPTVVSPAAAVVADIVPQNPPSQNAIQQGSRSPSSSSENQHPSGGIPAAPKAHDRSPLVDYSRALNGNGVPSMSMYRPNFGQAFQRPAPFPALFPPTAVAAAATAALPTFPHSASPLPIANGDAGPTDLSMKAKPLLTHKLNATEMATVRQLITGYRESAAFLLRSADELEQLLIQQQ